MLLGFLQVKGTWAQESTAFGYDFWCGNKTPFCCQNFVEKRTSLE